MKRLIVTAVLLATLVAVPTALADQYVGNCNQPYGGGNSNCVVTTIVVNKTVQDPKSKNYVDNLGMNDAKYGPEGTVSFKISVTNNGNTDLTNVVVQDIFPENVTFYSGNGSYDTNTRKLSFTVPNIKKNETQTLEVMGKIASASAFSANQGTICLTNQSKAMVNNQTFGDNASFCIEKSVLGVVYPQPKITTTPATGAEALSFIALLPAALSGFLLRKKAIN